MVAVLANLAHVVNAFVPEDLQGICQCFMAQIRTHDIGQSGSQSLTLGASAGKAQDEQLWTHGISVVAALLSTPVEQLLGHREQDVNLSYMSRGFCTSGGSADTNHRACGFLRRGKVAYSRATGLSSYNRSASVDACRCKSQRLRADLSDYTHLPLPPTLQEGVLVQCSLPPSYLSAVHAYAP